MAALFLCRHSSSSQTGWFWQNRLPQGNGLGGVSFTDANTGTAVGDHGTILLTTNGGVMFVEQPKNAEVPSRFVLKQNYPNPFNPTTNFELRICFTESV